MTKELQKLIEWNNAGTLEKRECGDNPTCETIHDVIRAYLSTL